MKVLKSAKMEQVLDRLGQAADLYVPMQRGSQSGFYSWKTYNKDSDELMFDILNVTQPPKNVVLPQTEKMYSFKQEGMEINIDDVCQDTQPKIIMGIRPCDVKGVEHLDSVFLTKGYIDEFYKSRRDQTTIIANACYNPGANCFCDAMGVNPTEPEAADVILREVQGGYIWEAKTEKGEAVTKQVADLLEEQDAKLPTLKEFTRKVDYEGVAEKLKDMFDHPIWQELSDPCQNCGICTYLCPTCYCFDIQVKTWGEEGYRFRCWDSCMYGEYSLMAGGHNPRATSKERFRNRYLHKLQFFKERYGASLCTGCGRCIVACPVGINIISIIQKIKEADTGA